jgi:citrate lyase subunit beta/citryl-CoA lyase
MLSTNMSLVPDGLLKRANYTLHDFRSLLIAPAGRLDLAKKMPRAGADGVVLDLEDGTPLAEKASARGTAAAGIKWLAATAPRQAVFVRLNSVGSGLLESDLEEVLIAGVAGFMLPKVAKVDEVRDFERLLVKLGHATDPLLLIVGIESALAVHDAVAILGSSERIAGAYFGAEDYVADVGARRTREGTELLYARSAVVVAARIANVIAIDQAVFEVGDDERFRLDAIGGRNLGFAGKLCIRPRQVEIAREVFDRATSLNPAK